MNQKHIVGLLDWNTVQQNIVDVLCGTKDADHPAYRIFVGLDKTMGVPVYMPFTTCKEVETTDTNAINALVTAPHIEPTGIILNSNLNGVFMQNIPCGAVTGHLGYAMHDTRTAVTGFQDVLREIVGLHANDLFSVDNPASLIIL